MDELREQTEAIAPPPEEPRWQPPPEGERAAAPLRLTLMPSELVVEVTLANAVVGRHSDVNLRLPLPDVSRQHCRLMFVDNAWRVRDLKSLNGVFVNDVRVQEAILNHHDTLRIGGFTFRVDLHSSEATLPIAIHEKQRVFRDITEALCAPPPSRKAS